MRMPNMDRPINCGRSLSNANYPALAGRVGFEQLDIKRCQMRRADHDDVFARNVVSAICWFSVVMQRLRDGPGGDKADAQYQGMNDRRRARNAVEPRKCEKHDGGHELRESSGFHQVQGIVNGEIARYSVVKAEYQKGNYCRARRDGPIEGDGGSQIHMLKCWHRGGIRREGRSRGAHQVKNRDAKSECGSGCWQSSRI